MIGVESFFFGIGLIVLIRLVWEDYTKKHKVNQSNSAFMMGIVAIMYVINGSYLMFFLLCIVFSIVFGFRDRLTRGWFEKHLCIGEGDTLILTWITTGLAIINPILIPTFFLIWFAGNTITSQYYKDYIGTPIIFISFLTTWITQEFLMALMLA